MSICLLRFGQRSPLFGPGEHEGQRASRRAGRRYSENKPRSRLTSPLAPPSGITLEPSLRSFSLFYDLEHSLQTYFRTLNRTVGLADGVYGAIKRRQISGKHNKAADGEGTREYVAGPHPNDGSGPIAITTLTVPA